VERVLEPEVMDTAEEAECYDAMDHSVPNEAFVTRLLELGARGRVLDVGCGPGHVALLLATMHPGVEVLGVDLSGHMLRIAEEHRAVSAHAARVRFERADAKRLPYANGAFDTVCSNTILHHIPDPVPFLRECGRVLAPGGALLVRDLFRPESAAAALALVERHCGGEDARAQALFRASLHAALTPAELATAAARAGLEGIEIVTDTDRHFSLQRRASRRSPPSGSTSPS
jgi:ubiquinone/menaquinone biosynthesis C-methylase UbiE